MMALPDTWFEIWTLAVWGPQTVFFRHLVFQWRELLGYVKYPIIIIGVAKIPDNKVFLNVLTITCPVLIVPGMLLVKVAISTTPRPTVQSLWKDRQICETDRICYIVIKINYERHSYHGYCVIYLLWNLSWIIHTHIQAYTPGV